MTKRKKLKPIEYAHGIEFNKNIVVTVENVDFNRFYEIQFCELSNCNRHIPVKIVQNRKHNRKEPETESNYARRRYCSIEHTQQAQYGNRSPAALRKAKKLYIILNPKDAIIDTFLGIAQPKRKLPCQH